MNRILVLTPTWRPAGGVVKILDYVLHARAHGLTVRLWSSEHPDPTAPIFQIERFSSLLTDPGIETVADHRIGVHVNEFVFVSWPADMERVLPRLPAGASSERIIHIIQNVRHANPEWEQGYPLRMLTRRVSRIYNNDIVRDACAPFVPPSSPSTVIPLGHELGFFRRAAPRNDLSNPVRVAYTTWKSHVGDRVAARLAGDGRFAFRSIRESVGWDQLRELYHWCDVFLGCPNPEEGFYMAGLEAMEAGALLIMPDAGGNRVYCDFGANSLEAQLEDETSYVQALEQLVSLGPDGRSRMRTRAFEGIERFDLTRERDAFGRFLAQVRSHLADEHSAGDPAAFTAPAEPMTTGSARDPRGERPSSIAVAQKEGPTGSARGARVGS